MPRERSRSPATKRRRTPERNFASSSRLRDVKRRRRSPGNERNDQHPKPSVGKPEVLSSSPNKGANSNRKPLERLGFISRFPGPPAIARNSRPAVRRTLPAPKKTESRRPATIAHSKDARKNQSSSVTRRKDSSGTPGSRLDQKPKDSFFRDDNRVGSRPFKNSDVALPPDHFSRIISQPIHRPLPEKERETYSDYRSAAYKDIDERQRLTEGPGYSNRRHSLSPNRYRISSPNQDPHRFSDNPMLRHDSPYRENIRDMDRDSYSTRSGKMSASDNYRHEGARSFKFDDAKITVDIRRKVREPSPAMRNMIDTGDIVLVRRVNEGCRPIFDREEIAVGLKHMEESSEYTERRVVAMLKSDRRSRSHSPERMGFPQPSHENFEVQRDKFESTIVTSDPSSSMIKPTLSDRWQQMDDRPRKPEGDRLDSHQLDNRSDYQMMHITTDERYRENFDRGPNNFPQDLPQDRTYSEMPINPSPSRERFQRLPEKDVVPRGRQNRFQRIQRNPNDLRHNLSRKRHGSLDTDLRPFDARLRILERKDGQKDTERRPADATTSDSRRKGDTRPTSSRSSRSRKVKDDHLPDFSTRPEKYKYQEWQDKPELIPKGSSYFEVTKHKDDRPSRIHSSYPKHDNRGESNFWTDRRGSGSYFPRSRGRGRFIGSFRSRGFSRGNFRGTRGRGIGYISRGHRDGGSPRQWKHDLFERSDDKPRPKKIIPYSKVSTRVQEIDGKTDSSALTR